LRDRLFFKGEYSGQDNFEFIICQKKFIRVFSGFKQNLGKSSESNVFGSLMTTFAVSDNFMVSAQTTGERTGLAAGTSLYKKHILKNWFVYIKPNNLTTNTLFIRVNRDLRSMHHSQN